MKDPSGDVILEMEGIVKTYDTLVANDQIDLHLRHGEILAVIGENGAGKTTLMKVLYGLEQADSGTIRLRGEPVQIRNTGQAIDRGIGMVQQHFMLFDPFTVAENIVYGKEPRKGLFFDLDQANKLISEISRSYELPLNPTDKIQGMPVGLRQRVEILKVLYQNTEIIIFDEPTAVLTPQEVHELLKTLKKLAADGKSIIIVTHKLNEVMEVADRVMVMRAGKLVAEMAVSDTTIEELSFLMVGRHLVETEIPAMNAAEKVLAVQNLKLLSEEGALSLDDVSLHVRAGEIVGIAGVSGNGQSELAQALFGLKHATSGQILVNGQDVFNQSVKTIRNAGVAMIPEDRYLWGSATQATLSETAIMGHYANPSYSKHGMLNIRNINSFAQRIIREFNVKADSIRQKTSSLSGGNAQKLIVAREIVQGTPLLLACEPTRGIDVGAINFIHDQLIDKRSKGAAILLISSDLSEILKLSDRIYVIYEGKINSEFQRGNVTEEELGLMMAGGKHENQLV